MGRATWSRALEMAASGGFYVIFFGIAALAIGGLHLLGFAGPTWIQFLLFSMLSIASLAFFRSPLMKWLQLDKPGRRRRFARRVRSPCRSRTSSRRGRPRRAARHGLVGPERDAIAIIRGQRCKVVRVDGLMIFLEPEGVRA